MSLCCRFSCRPLSICSLLLCCSLHLKSFLYAGFRFFSCSVPTKSALFCMGDLLKTNSVISFYIFPSFQCSNHNRAADLGDWRETHLFRPVLIPLCCSWPIPPCNQIVILNWESLKTISPPSMNIYQIVITMPDSFIKHSRTVHASTRGEWIDRTDVFITAAC